jgi:hypothetical protein
MRKFSVVTPLARPRCEHLCRASVARQVGVDVVEHLVMRERLAQGYPDVWMKLAVAAEVATGDILAIMEDDDWYGPHYLGDMLAYEDAPMGGWSHSRAYHLPSRRYNERPTGAHACTSFFVLANLDRRMLCRMLRRMLGMKRIAGFIGGELGEETDQFVAMKGLPRDGRAPLSMHHNESEFPIPDADGSVLRSWIGGDSEMYLGCL